MMHKYEYDRTILGASIPAAVAAIKARRSGNKVLMINRYGFPGGPVTENLCCHLLKPAGTKTSLITKEIYELLSRTEHGLLYEDQTSIVLDPEAVKYRLQELLLAEGVELLWHVTPWHTKIAGDRLVELSLLAKEGMIVIRSDEWIGNDLLPETGAGPGAERDLYYCFFYVCDRQEKIDFPGMEAIKLAGRRCWAAVHRKIGRAEQPAIFGQRLIDEISGKLAGRVQLLPAEPFSGGNPGSADPCKCKNIHPVAPADTSIPFFKGDFRQAEAIEGGVI